MNLFSVEGWVAGLIAAIVVAVVLLLIMLMVFISRYKKCPSDKVMVIYGKLKRAKGGAPQASSKCIHGGAQFVWPFFQAYSFLDLTPISLNVDLKNALSHQNIRVDVPSRFTVGISTEPGIMQNAAERLRGLRMADIQDLASDIILGQLRLVVALMDIEEINTNRDKFLDEVSRNVETELKKIGLKLINVNVTDIRDESGYIEALGKEAASKAINDAKKSVAERDRDGAIGEANAIMDQRINVAKANSAAVEGENLAKAKIAQANADLREAEADAERRATAAEKIAQANALKEAYEAQREAEEVRAKREQSTLEADVIVKAEIEKHRLELEAEAQAEQARRKARGLYELLSRQAQGFDSLVKASGAADSAVKMMIADKLEELTRIQVDAIKNIKIDKVTVWDGGANGEKSSTAGFISGLYKSVPPLSELFRSVGMELPDYLGKVQPEKPVNKPVALDATEQPETSKPEKEKPEKPSAKKGK